MCCRGVVRGCESYSELLYLGTVGVLFGRFVLQAHCPLPVHSPVTDECRLCCLVRCVEPSAACAFPCSSLEGVGSPASFPKFQHPSHQLLKANGFKQQQYYKYRHNCYKGE